MPAEVIADPVPCLAYVVRDGSRKAWVEGGRCPRLALDLLAGAANLVHPHGRLDSRGSVTNVLIGIRRLVNFASERGFSGGAQELRRPLLVEFWMGSSSADERLTKAALRALDQETGMLDPKVRALIHGRSFNPTRHGDNIPPYSEAEWSRIIGTCERHVRGELAAHRAVVQQGRAGRDPLPEGDWAPGNAAWLLIKHGPLTVGQLRRRLHTPVRSQLTACRVLAAARRSLFPDTQVVISYQILFGAYTGVVPDGIDSLGLEDLDWSGDTRALLRYFKGRTSREGVALSGRAVRLMERWLEHSAVLRPHLPAAEAAALWIRDEPTAPSQATTLTRITPPTVQEWVRRRELRDDQGGWLRIHRQRIRTTFHSHRDRRAWTGSARATIDPNHSPQVEGDSYLTAATPAQRAAVDEIITQAQGDLLRKAHPPVVLSEAETLTLVRDYPAAVARLDLDNVTITELVGGERDVFVAACADQLSGLHGPKGKPCPARPWVCLLCPLAIFTPRHAANVLRLKAFFARQWLQMPAAHFMAVFGPYAQRVDEVIALFDAAVITEAAVHVSGHDSEIPLRPEESTQ
jgi:hypothetical protein